METQAGDGSLRLVYAERMVSTARLRVYADFNSVYGVANSASATEIGWCWCLKCDGRDLEGPEQSLGLYDGMPATLYYADRSEEFEVDAVLGRPDAGRWKALYDMSTFRRIRG